MTCSFVPARFVVVVAWLCAFAALFLAATPARAQFTLVSTYGFTGGTDGAYPDGSLVQGSDGSFYGTTYGTAYRTGSSGYGTVFKVTASGALTTLVNFTGANGANPIAGLVQGSDGNFYGTTAGGGSSFSSDPTGDGYGTVFKVTASGALTTLVNFTGANGQYPIAGLVQGSDGSFYGTTYYGGSPNAGTVFKVTSSGALTTLYNFSALNVNYENRDGGRPYGGLVQGSDGSFYGTTSEGGSSGDGTIFKITPAGVLTTLHTFNFADGSSPVAGLIQGSDGNFYGTTDFGGSSNSGVPYGLGYGTVFKVTSSGTLTTLVNFDNTNGERPEAGLVQGSDGNFYGTTYYGGSSGNGYPLEGNGTVFRMTALGALTTVANFDGTNGQYLIAGLVQGSDGNFYGTTEYGGSSIPSAPFEFGYGTVFKLVPFGSSSVWSARDTAAAPDGTARLLWTRSDGAAGIWSMSASDTQASVGPAYGPFPGWSANAVSVAGDGTTRVLWTNTNGDAGVWSFNPQETETAIGPTYGPYPGWTAADIATASNGTSRLLWTRSDGAASVWTLSAFGMETIEGPTYGPYTGWTAKAVGAAGDGTARVLWTNTNGDAGIWSFNAADAETVIGKTYGPYSGWSASDLGTSNDGTSSISWTNTNGQAGVWTFSAADTETVIGPTYGPFAGYTAAALDTANDQSRVLWVNSSRAAGLWTFDGNDDKSVVGSVYGPF